MFELKENGFFATPKTQEELNKLLEKFGRDAMIGAMIMMNFIAYQYNQGNIE